MFGRKKNDMHCNHRFRQPTQDPRASHGRDSGEPRLDLIRRVRRQIAEGRYESEAKWQVVVERLLGEVAPR